MAAVAGRDAGVPSPTRRAVLLAGLPPSQPKPPAPPRGDVPFAGPVVAAAAGHLGDQILVDERHFFSPLIVHRAVAACPYPLPLGVAVGAPARCFIERRRLRQRSTSRSTQSRYFAADVRSSQPVSHLGPLIPCDSLFVLSSCLLFLSLP